MIFQCLNFDTSLKELLGICQMDFCSKVYRLKIVRKIQKSQSMKETFRETNNKN